MRHLSRINRYDPNPVVKLPDLHADQVRAFTALQDSPFKVFRAGRRWGKTRAAQVWAADGFCRGMQIGWFAPDHKRWSEAYQDILNIIDPMRLSSSKGGGVIRGRLWDGRFDFWTLDDDSAGRSRFYNRVVIDEAAFTNAKTMLGVWEKAIKPTLFDTQGECLVCSNTNGNDSENFMYKICHEPKFRFKQFHAPTHNNPMLPKRMPWESAEDWMVRREAALAKLQSENHPLVYQQEYLAEFVDFSGVAFFSLPDLLLNGQPHDPVQVDTVYAVIDTAVKDGKEHDGTGVTYFGYSATAQNPVSILDWDIIQIQGSLLETWLPTVFQNLEELAKKYRARMGSIGAHIEDKGSGTILLQQAIRRGWRATPIDMELTNAGKDSRAISVSGYVIRGKVKLTQHAKDKVKDFKGTTRNHLISQVTGFRVGDKDNKRADDLFDTFCYGIAIALGNRDGY